MTSGSLSRRPGALFSVLAWGLVLGGCNMGVKSAVGANGTHVLTCGTGMKACVVQAEKICGDDGYQIIDGISVSKLLGGSSSSYRTKSEKAELTVKCGMPEEDEQPVVEEKQYKLPPRTDEPIEPAEPVPAPATDAPETVCTPGATQACVGPGACKGGQVCLDSGAGYGPCDCGGSREAGPTSAAPGPEPKVEVPGAAPDPAPLSK